MWARKGAAVAFQPQIRLRDLIAPILLTVAAILLTSLLINEAHAHLTVLHIWHDPEHLTLAYILPTIFITALFGSKLRGLECVSRRVRRCLFRLPAAIQLCD